ncbi:hypothetical protein CIPAW_01G152700, partial [Carya illinoinensis]
LDHVSDIKLIRTDTTLDLSQKAEKAAVAGPPPKKINLISCGPLDHVSDIKLIRTDTTLDLSQKAEKGMLIYVACFSIYRSPQLHSQRTYSVWD